MSFKDEYKNEVGSVSLSAEFKENLKKICIEEATKALESDGGKNITVSQSESKSIYTKLKLYKYISVAACLVAVISTIGVVSLMSSKLSIVQTNKTDAAANDTAAELYDITEEPASEEPNDELDEIAITSDADDTFIDVEEIPDESVPEATVFDAVDDRQSPVASATPVTDNADGYDSSYSGDYSSADYILASPTTAMASNTANVSSASSYKRSSDSNLPTSKKYSDALNFYDILNTRIKDEAALTGATLVRLYIKGTNTSDSIPSPGSDKYTCYNVRINYDYLNQTSCNYDACVWIKGTESDQIDGMPCYGEGEEILASLYALDNGCVTVVDELLYDIYNLSATDIAYHRYYGNINPGTTNMGIFEVEKNHITTTANNPTMYVHKAVVKELTRYIRRKIVNEGFDFADLKWLAKVSKGEESLTAPASAEPAPAEPEPEEPPVEETPGDEPEAEAPSSSLPTIKTLKVNSSDDKLIVRSGDEVIRLHDEESTAFLAAQFSNSATGSEIAGNVCNVMFVGGKLAFNSEESFSGELTRIEITGTGCPLNISFRGLKVGDTLGTVKKTLHLENQNLDSNCVITYSGDKITAILTIEYGALAKIVIK